jgi:NAD(P)H-dependent FMN reductase
MMKKILVIPGSNRSGSHNVKLAAAAAKEFALLGADVTRISLLDYPLPLYDEDLKSNDGIPKNASKIASLIDLHDGVFIASPEYNASVSPLLKNMIDWVSVIREIDGRAFAPWKEATLALGAASPGNLGGVRGSNHLRSIMVSIGSLVISEQVLVPKAGTAFGEDDSISSERTSKSLTTTCRALLRMSVH